MGMGMGERRGVGEVGILVWAWLDTEGVVMGGC